MITADAELIRLLPTTVLPDYTYFPGSGMPHPIRDPKGHSYGRKHAPGRDRKHSTRRPGRAIEITFWESTF